ncbi:MAG: ABC transporter ATP-binding protein [Thermomicrobiales bacterium]
MASLTLTNLVKRFGQVTAVDELNLEIKDQEFVTFLGPSGCGKTTTLRMIAGLDKPSGGDILFDGTPVTHLPANHRDIAMVFQSYALYPHMTVYDNIAFALKMMRMPSDEIRRRVESAAAMLGITELLQRKPRQLSGGQRQRVALGRAIVRAPAAYLLDEPLSNLDAQLRIQMRAELKKLHLELQGTFIYVTHDQAEALTMSDRIAVMNQGKLLQYDSPYEIYNHPRTRFVASFMGSPPMNFITGEVVAADEGNMFRSGGLACRLPGEFARRLRPPARDSVILGIRPEAIDVAIEQPDREWHEGTVSIVEPIGSDSFLTVDLRGVQIRARTTPDFMTRPGGKVYVRFNPTKLHAFDPQSGDSLL